MSRLGVLDRPAPAAALPVLKVGGNDAASYTRLAVFIHCPDQLLHRLVFKSKVQDWIAQVGDVPVEPPTSIISEPADASLDNNVDNIPEIKANTCITAADRLRLIHELIIGPTYEGGAGVILGQSRFQKGSEPVGAGYVDALFTLHDIAFCNKWLGSWSRKWFLGSEDISLIRETMGERIGFYFAFMQFYIKSLIPVSVISLFFYFFAPTYSPIYAVILIVWSAAFVVLWRREAILLAHRWGTLNQGSAAKTRPNFRPDKIHVDVATGERVPYYPEWKRMLARAVLTLPIILFFTALISIVSLAILVVEVFFTDYYDGPFKSILAMVPVLSLCCLHPVA
ncbi:calcium-activated chloride channel-domain-containing protein [Chytridium lagenaria]|nr:calcium-activated chloride channel-domain-containing protein [Chytridium lagenaria]